MADLPIAAPSDHRHQSQRLVLEEIADELRLNVTILKPGGSHQWRGLMNLLCVIPLDRLGRLAHALQSLASIRCWTRCSAALGLSMIALLLCDLPL